MTQSETTKKMQRALMSEMDKLGIINHLNTMYMSELVPVVLKSNNKRLKPAIKPGNTSADAIAQQLVLEYLKKHEILEETLKIVKTEIKASEGGNVAAKSNTSKLNFKQNEEPLLDLISWNKTRVEEINEKKRLEEEEKRSKRARKFQEELRVQTRSVASIEEEQQAAPERKVAASVMDINSPRKKIPQEARSEYIMRGSDTSFRFIKKPVASMLPEGSQSPSSPKQKHFKPFIQVSNNTVGTSVYGPPSVRGAPSVISMPATAATQKNVKINVFSERPPAVNTGVASQSSGSTLGSPLVE